MKEQLLIDHGYKYLWFIVLGAFLLVLILPFFKSVDLSVGALGLLLSVLAEVLTTFFQHKHITFIISLVLGWLLALIISVILFFLHYVGFRQHAFRQIMNLNKYCHRKERAQKQANHLNCGLPAF